MLNDIKMAVCSTVVAALLSHTFCQRRHSRSGCKLKGNRKGREGIKRVSLRQEEIRKTNDKADQTNPLSSFVVSMYLFQCFIIITKDKLMIHNLSTIKKECNCGINDIKRISNQRYLFLQGVSFSYRTGHICPFWRTCHTLLDNTNYKNTKQRKTENPSCSKS